AALDRDEFELSWLAFEPANDALIARAGPGVTIDRFQKVKTATRMSFPLVAKIAERLKQLDLDVLHVHNWSTSVYGILAARIAGIPHVLYGNGGRGSMDRPSPRQV